MDDASLFQTLIRDERDGGVGCGGHLVQLIADSVVPLGEADLFPPSASI